jgi:hypothetical protein
MYATELQNFAWASKIVYKLVLELSPGPHTWEDEHPILYETSPQGRRESWELLERMFDQYLTRGWIFEVRLPPETCYFPELSKAFVKKMIKYIGTSPVAVGDHTMRFCKIIQCC